MKTKKMAISAMFIAAVSYTHLKKRKSICRCISLWSDKRKDDVFLHSKDKFFVVFAQKGQKRTHPQKYFGGDVLHEKRIIFLPAFCRSGLRKMCIRDRVGELGIKNGQLLWPVRTALSGEPTSPGGAMELADILGKEESLRRIRKGIELLKG